MTATISASGKLEGTITAFQREEPCVVSSGETEGYEVAITAPDKTKAEFEVETHLVRCIGTTGVFKATFSYELNDPAGAFGETAPSGSYKVRASDCCRVSGIINTKESGFSLDDTIRNVPGTATSTPAFLGLTAVGAAKGYVYSGDVSASDPIGGGLTYALMQNESEGAPNFDPNAPEFNVGNLNGSRFEVPAATTEGWSAGAYFVYKVKTADIESDSAELDILVKVTTNRPPSLTVPSEVTIVEGESDVVPFSATDPDPETVTINSDSVPAWGTIATSEGNPATGTATLAPPIGTTGTFYVALDATDSNPDVVLLDSKVITVHVVPRPPAFSAHPAAQTTETKPTFAFTLPSGTKGECSLDGAAFEPCSSPFQTPALAVGAHTFAVRAIGSEGATSAVQVWKWTVLAAASAPIVVPGSTQCVSRRLVVVHWLVPAKLKIGAVIVAISGTPPRRLGPQSRQTTIDLRGLGAATVTVMVTTRTKSGRKLKTLRVLHTCEVAKAVAPLKSLALH